MLVKGATDGPNQPENWATVLQVFRPRFEWATLTNTSTNKITTI